MNESESSLPTQKLAVKRNPRHDPRFIDKTGMICGQLTVLEFYDVAGGASRWKCLCTCGNIAIVRSGKLQTGERGTKSCGCLIGCSIKHGEVVNGKPTTEYRAWAGIKDRCGNPNAPLFKFYGRKGIKVCQRLGSNFKYFLEDLGRKPTPELSIDRWPDKYGNYSCGKCDECLRNGWKFNCRWATVIQQQNNRTNNVELTYQGRTQNASQWAKEFGLADYVLYHRLKAGWSVEDALTKPLNASSRRFKKKPNPTC